MSVLGAVSVAEIKARGSIKDVDVAKLRKAFADDSTLTADDAEGLFALNDACPIQDPAWADCFIELETDYLVDQVEPLGYLNADKAQWLRDKIAVGGSIQANTKLDLLLSVLERSRWTPQSLAVLALEQVRRAIADGEGPLRAGKLCHAQTVHDIDVDMLRRILCAFGMEDADCVTRAEAEVLLAIDALTAGSENHGGWRSLFVAAMGSAMLGASGYAAPPRPLILAGDGAALLAGFTNLASGMATGGRPMLPEYRLMSREERAITRLTQQKVAIITREEVPALDAGWIAEYMTDPSHRTPNVMALLGFMKSEGRKLDPRLQVLVDLAPAVAA